MKCRNCRSGDGHKMWKKGEGVNMNPKIMRTSYMVGPLRKGQKSKSSPSEEGGKSISGPIKLLPTQDTRLSNRFEHRLRELLSYVAFAFNV